MLKKYLPVIVFLVLLVSMFWSVWLFPSLTFAFVIAILLLFLAISIFSILEKHKGAENQRQKITRDILILLFTLILVVLLGGVSGLWVSEQAGGQFGAFVGALCAVAVSFAVGYLVRKGMRKLVS